MSRNLLPLDITDVQVATVLDAARRELSSRWAKARRSPEPPMA